MDICFDLVQPSSVPHLDLYQNCLFLSWLKINNFNYSDFNHSVLHAITRTRPQKSPFIGWMYKDFGVFILNRIIALGMKGGKKKRSFQLEICFTLTFNPYINISSFFFLQIISNSFFFFLAITILNCQRKLESLLFS